MRGPHGRLSSALPRGGGSKGVGGSGRWGAVSVSSSNFAKFARVRPGLENHAPPRGACYCASSMASHRIGARLSGLSPQQLCAFIDEQAPLWRAAALRVAEEHAARLVEQPEWVLSDVLLSPDLAQHILAQLPTKEHAVKGTCRAWRRGWKETLETRERPRMLVFAGATAGVFPLNSLERYDPATNEWEEEAVAPMPTARSGVRWSMLHGKLYAVGGAAFSSVAFSATLVERYDLATKVWDAVAPMATARNSHAVAVLDGIYAVGGEDYEAPPGAVLSSMERYDPATNAWEAVAPMAAARKDFDVAVLDGKLYAVGGLNADEGALSTVERYDPATNVWEAVAPLTRAMECLSVAVLDGKLYAIGGYGDGYLTSVERYDPALNAWEAVAPLAAARAGHDVAALDGKLYVAGGYDGNNYLSSVEMYDPAGNAWQEVAPLLTARSAHGIAVL